MTAATLDRTDSLELAYQQLDRTAGLRDSTHLFEGGNHEFSFVDEGGEDGPVVTLKLDDEEFYVDRPALESAVKRMPGADEAVANRWPLQMVMDPLNWFFDNRDGEFKAITIGDNVVAITKPRALLFEPRRILDYCVDEVAKYGGKETIEVDHFVHNLDLTRFTVRPAAEMTERFIEARPGDVTLGALNFEASLLGKIPMELSAATHRVECGNGMISAAGVRKFKVNGDADAESTLDALDSWVSETCAQLYGGASMDDEFQRIHHLVEHEIEGHTSDVLADLFSRLRISASFQTHVHDALADEADGTMYGVVQAMTRAATHAPGLTENQRANLMRSASTATIYAQDLCESCRRPTH